MNIIDQIIKIRKIGQCSIKDSDTWRTFAVEVDNLFNLIGVENHVRISVIKDVEKNIIKYCANCGADNYSTYIIENVIRRSCCQSKVLI